MRKFALAILLSFALMGCSLQESVADVPTSTPEPTVTATPTNTPQPTATHTPTATATFTPTPIPIGGTSGEIVFNRYCRTESGEDLYNIFLMDVGNVEDGEVLNLTNNEDPSIVPYFPQWSIDGLRVLYTRYEDDLENNLTLKGEIFEIDMENLSVQKLSPIPQYVGSRSMETGFYDAQGTASPDGTMVAFSSNRHIMPYTSSYEIYSLNLETFEIERLTNYGGTAQHPMWSPDGSRLAFQANWDGDWDVYIMNSDGSEITKLTNNLVSDRFPDWSPDGSQIVFHSDRDGNVELYTIDVETQEENRLTTNPAADSSADWSPDGEWLVFHSDRSGDEELYLLELSTLEVTQLTNESNCTSYLGDWRP